MTPYRQASAGSAGGSEMSFAAIVADVEALIALLRQLEDAERFPRKERPIHVNELRPMVRQALDEHRLTRDRSEHWQEQVRNDEIAELVAYLREQIEVPEELWLPTRNENVVAIFLFPVALVLGVLGVMAVMEGSRESVINGAFAAVIGVVGMVYGVAWLIPRRGSERRVYLGLEDVWLPATGLSLRNHRVRYQDIQSVTLHSHGDRKLRVTFAGGTAHFGHRALDIRQLAEELETRTKATERIARVRQLYAS